ncbi:SRPBCC family protein [Ornithinimicrobium cavernae]|uniref:SRPBCC family protein n=1 Tax=Ornithinimicrobium cavernae TaxID=2666047 RepID=UPI000D69CEE2|nr:SRPBCC family protein [Ornithinimicrobium cavernae]
MSEPTSQAAVGADQQDATATTRGLDTRTTEHGEAKVQTVTQTYATTVEDLWEAVTSAERLPRWFLPVSGDLRVGGTYQLEGNAGGTIETCEAPHRFTATWEFGGQVTWIAVTLSPAGAGARLELEHTAVIDESNPEQQEFWAQFGPGATGVGWDLALMGLGAHVATGATMDPAASEAWSVSPEGVAYISECSRLWGEASIADGTPRDQAEAAAARTTAFYTGQPDPTAPQDGAQPEA